MPTYKAPLEDGSFLLNDVFQIGRHNNLPGAGAASTDYLHLFGLVALGYMWARMAKAALAKLGEAGEQLHLKAKLVTGKFFMERMLPETSLRLSRI